MRDKEQIPVFVFNLKRSKDRKNWMQQHLISLGVDSQFVEAIDSKQLTQEEMPAVLHKPNMITMCYRIKKRVFLAIGR